MRLLLPAPGFPPLFYEINISEEPASFTISGFDHARGLRSLAFALRSYESIDDPWGHLPVPAGAWRDRCRRIVVPDRHHRRGSARCVSERDPGRRRGSSKATASRALLPCPTSNQANVADLMAAVQGLAVRPGQG